MQTIGEDVRDRLQEAKRLFMAYKAATAERQNEDVTAYTKAVEDIIEDSQKNQAAGRFSTALQDLDILLDGLYKACIELPKPHLVP